MLTNLLNLIYALLLSISNTNAINIHIINDYDDIVQLLIRFYSKT